ncbi:DUF2312 domain-containing protein [Pseudomonas sp. GX19020]|uniref:DUF2312 domain-containing protein n=1 Tax=Pseudomonas sp. GX19020 TaxID=2942277 RepID=UPI0024B751B9|nr:DUF2312 domain-containing protein [Pseudomonas sp. GX19020]
MDGDTRMTIRAGGEEIQTTMGAVAGINKALDKVARKSKRTPMKETEADKKVTSDAFSVTGDELRQLIERIEQFEAEKKDISEQLKEVYAEAKGRGFDTKALRKIVSLRKQDPDERQEAEAILEVYMTALGMS